MSGGSNQVGRDRKRRWNPIRTGVIVGIVIALVGLTLGAALGLFDRWLT